MNFRGADLRSLQTTPQVQATPTLNDVVENLNDTQTGMLLGIPRSARCVQRFDDSLNSAIHITYRISLRSSSMREPRDPLLKVVYLNFIGTKRTWFNILNALRGCENDIDLGNAKAKLTLKAQQSQLETNQHKLQVYNMCTVGEIKMTSVHMPKRPATACASLFNNDPSAGSPTETLLRLLLPLNDQVWSTSQQRGSVAGSPKPIRRPH